ncbi:MAG: HDOD domain-containing protein [Actinomycetota bacterium]
MSTLDPTLDIHHQILDRAESLRPLPITVVRLAGIVADPDSDVEDMVAVLREDPTLVASLLREANSAWSGPTSNITTIQAAATRLGSGRVLAIAMDVSLDLQAPLQLVAYDVTTDELREHAIWASFVAEAVQNLAKDRIGPEAITAAFLHDIGKGLLDQYIDPRFLRFAWAPDRQIVEAEHELAGVDHAELGALLMELWGIPQPIADAIRYHHEPQLSPTPLAAAVAIADGLSHQFRGTRAGTLDETVEWSLRQLGLERETVVDRTEKVLFRAGLLD